MNRQRFRPAHRATAALVLGLAAAAAIWAAPADNPAAPVSAVRLKGYLNFRYAYVGSSAASTIGSTLRLSGSFRLSALNDKIVLRYRSHHWVSFQRPENSVLESPFENRHILQTVAVETNGLFLPGLKTTLGRFFPEFDYASLPVLDGGAVRYERSGFSLTAAAGRMVDAWSGREAGSDLFAAAQVKYQDGLIGLSAGFNSGRYFGLVKKEIPVGFRIFLSRSVWLESYAGYDLDGRDLARAGLSAAWHSETTTMSLLLSQWRNPFDQLYLLDKSKSSGTWGLYAENVPVLYQDVRFSTSWGARGFGLRGTFGLMAGVRSGWLGSASMTILIPAGIRLNAGGQALRTDLIEFASFDFGAEKILGTVTLRLQSQFRVYQWRPRDSGFDNVDDYSEFSLELPLGRHFYFSAAGGGYIRTLGNERFKPQAELRLIVRM